MRKKIWTGTMTAAALMLSQGLMMTAVQAAAYSWNSPNAGNWNDLTANGWNGAAYPNSAADTATFSQNLTGNKTITINVADAMVSALTLTDSSPSHNWTIARTSTNVLTLNNGASAATITSTTGTNTISAPLVLNSNLDITVTGTQLNLTGGVSGNGKSLIINASSTGVVRVASTALNDNLNSIIVNGGTLSFDGTNSHNGINGITVNAGGTLMVTGGWGGLYDSTGITLNDTGVLNYSGYSGTDWLGGIASNSAASRWIMGSSGGMILGSNSVFNGVISGGGSGTIAFSNGYTLGGVNTYVGKFALNGNTLNLNIANSIADASELYVNSGATVNIGGNDQSFVSITGSGTIKNSVDGANTITITGGDGKNFAGVIKDGSATQIMQVIVNATGTQIFSGVNTYTGGTTINAGTLIVNGSLASGVVLNNGTLGGAGSIAGAVTVNDATLAPGNSPGTLLIANALNLTSGSVLDYQFDATDQTVGAGINDLIDHVTDLTLDGTLNVTVLNGTELGAGVWRIIDYTGALSNLTLDLGLVPVQAGLLASIDTSIGGQVNLVVSAVPEPASLALLGIGGLLIGRTRRRRA